MVSKGQYRQQPRLRQPVRGRVSRANGFPRKASGLEVLTSDDGVVVYQAKRDRVHYLNQTAYLVLELANGRNSPQAIASRLREVYELPALPERDVALVLEQMKREKLIETSTPSLNKRSTGGARRQAK